MIDEVFVARNEYLDPSSACAGEELVVVWVNGNRFGQSRSVDDLGPDCQKSEDRTEIYAGVLGAEGRTDPAVLVQNCGREDQLQSAVAPCCEDPSGDTAKEHGRNENVGVEDDPHRSERTFATARFTSTGLIPAFLAALRAV